MSQQTARHINFCLALEAQNLELVKYWLDAGAEPDFPGGESSKPPAMHVAAEHGFVAGMEVLKKAGANVDVQGSFQYTPFMTAAYYGQREAGEWLLQHGANPAALNVFDETAMDVALEQGHGAFAQMIMDQCPDQAASLVDIAARRAAIMSSDPKIAQWLLDRGASPNVITKDGRTWLMAAQFPVLTHTAEMTNVLLKAGADINHLGTNGDTALHEAAKHGRVAPFIRLLHAGADPDLADHNGNSVRTLLQTHRKADLHAALIAWETSQAAHQIIRNTTAPSAIVRSL